MLHQRKKRDNGSLFLVELSILIKVVLCILQEAEKKKYSLGKSSLQGEKKKKIVPFPPLWVLN
jgi:hypothetical protein